MALVGLVQFLDTAKWVFVVIFLMFVLRRLILERRHCNRKKMPGRVVIITGGNGAIGFSTALDLAWRKAKIILACRDRTKGELAAEKIRKTTRNNNVVFRELDLSSLDSVAQFARTILTTETKVDILINNAGVMACPSWRNEDGFEIQLTVNYLGHFLLTNLLLNLLGKCNGKVINVVSNYYNLGEINFHDFHSRRNYDPWKSFYQSQLAIILSTKEQSRRFRSSKVSVNAVFPGHTVSDIRRHSLFKYPVQKFFLYPFAWLFWKSPQQGALPIIDLVVSQRFDGVTGMYFENFKKRSLRDDPNLNDNLAQRLWKKSAELVNLEQFRPPQKRRYIVENQMHSF